MENPTLDYHIIASSSDGNAVRVGNILFDCGVPFKVLKEDLYLVDYLLITHDHHDHVKPATLRSIVREFPNIRIFSTYRVAQMNDSVVPINLDYLPLELGDKLVYAVEVPHDVVTYGYIVQGPDTAYVYATDLGDTKSLTEVCQGLGVRFDAVFLEANYDPEKLRALGNEWRGNYNPYHDSTSRHLSTDESSLFYARFKKEGGKHIELHKSHRFY